MNATNDPAAALPQDHGQSLSADSLPASPPEADAATGATPETAVGSLDLTTRDHQRGALARLVAWIWSWCRRGIAAILRLFSPATAHAFLSDARSSQLRPLTPRFEADKHGVYVQHLLEGLTTEGVHNIALAGRYGAGKSSVIAGLVKHLGWRRRRRVVQLSLSTLDPRQPVGSDDGGSAKNGSAEQPAQSETGKGDTTDADEGPSPLALSTTNRIQKELVKQLLYRERPRKLPDSRFHRITRRAPVRSALVGVGAATFIWAGLYVLDLLPSTVPVGDGDPLSAERAGHVLLACLIAVGIGFVHFVAWGRISLLGVGAAGTSVTLGPKSSSYFDQYLDEVIYFFEKTGTNIVIFEDLDRFDDHHIFQSLRDLNTLLNSRARQRRHKIRFVYATKDSLFEGHAQPKGVEDQAAAEMDRANRTKFFELVVPVVPFISHRNARDLMGNALAEAGWTVGSEEGQLDPRLVDTVARNATEMRMLVNICNEFSVFANQLLPSSTAPNNARAHGAPGLEPDKLLALVAYKNFHLMDFELILRRKSKLDDLAAVHDELVRTNLEILDRQVRAQELRGVADAAKAKLARSLGERLSVMSKAVLTPSGLGSQPFGYKTDTGDAFTEDLTRTPEFWAETSSANTIRLVRGASLSNVVHSFSKADWDALWPEAVDAETWAELDRVEHERHLAALAAEAGEVRGASFKFAYDRAKYTVPSSDNEERGPISFSEAVERVLVSELGRDLVREGYLDRNFGLYAAQFYGEFSGRDVADFVYQAVQPNKMRENFEFARPGSIENLFREVPPDFTRSPSVLNIEIFDHLLATDAVERDEALAFLAQSVEGVGGRFIDAYFNRGKEREALAAALARLGWDSVLTYLSSSDQIPESASRSALVSAALLGLPPDAQPDVSSHDVAQFLESNIGSIPALCETQSDLKSTVIYGVLERAGVVVEKLSGLGVTLMEKVVRGRSYRLTRDNLITATRVDGLDDELTFERLMEHEAAWAYCLAKPVTFLEAVTGEPAPTLTAEEDTLVEVLSDAARSGWDEEQMAKLVSLSARTVAVRVDDQLLVELWPLLAAGDRLELSVSNVGTYREGVGIDEALGKLLSSRLRDGADDVIRRENGEDEQSFELAVAILDAAEVLPEATARASLAAQLTSVPVPLIRLPIEEGELLGELLDHGLVEDVKETFAKYGRELGWTGLAPIADREEFLTGLEPDVVEGAVADLLADPKTPAPVIKAVLSRLDEFVPEDERGALANAADACCRTAGAKLDPADVVRIARVLGHSPEVVRLLAKLTKAALPNEQFVEALGHLGAPLDNFDSKVETQFPLPGDPGDVAVVRKAEARGLASLSRKGLSGTKVNVL